MGGERAAQYHVRRLFPSPTIITNQTLFIALSKSKSTHVAMAQRPEALLSWRTTFQPHSQPHTNIYTCMKKQQPRTPKEHLYPSSTSTKTQLIAPHFLAFSQIKIYQICLSFFFEFRNKSALSLGTIYLLHPPLSYRLHSTNPGGGGGGNGDAPLPAPAPSHRLLLSLYTVLLKKRAKRKYSCK